MNSLTCAVAYLPVIFAGWVHRRGFMDNENLKAENQMLREGLKGRRLRFTNAVRVRMASITQALAQNGLLDLGICTGS